MQILDGKLVAAKRRMLMAGRVEKFVSKAKRPPGLAVILVGDDPASQVYVKNKMKACQDLGFHSTEERLPSSTTPEQLKKVIDRLNGDPQIDGMILQLPVPKAINTIEAINWISPDKDADGLTHVNMGRLFSGHPLTRPCTPWGIMILLQQNGISVEGKNAVVIGRSQIVGKPMAQLLLEANATVTVCHSKTKDLRQFTRRADIVVVAAGQPEFLGREDFAPGSVIVDVGIHRREKGGLCGDVRFDEIQDYVQAATPVPGGVGPMTITMLLENTLVLAEHRAAKV